MNLIQLKSKLRKKFSPHYLIIGAYSKKPIGCTCGQSGKNDVLAEEPGCMKNGSNLIPLTSW